MICFFLFTFFFSFFLEIYIPRLELFCFLYHTDIGIFELGQKNTDIEREEKKEEGKEYVSSRTGDNIEEKLHRL